MAKPRRNANVKLVGVVRRRRAALLVSTALCATVTMVVSLPAAAQPAANAHPTGGVVVGGSATISQTASQTTINQSTQRGAINWQTFNVGSQQSVDFVQPSSSAVTLNKVVTPNPSQIAGKIDANGQVIIENQSGVIFYKGSQVNTAGLMVTAAASSDAATRAFINGGQLALDQAANPNAAVVNQGQITIKQAGLAALVAPQVVNSGVITAKLGTVVLAGGATKATLDLYGDGMLSIDVTGQVVQAPNGAMALVTNSGLIVADGGSVQLTASAADGIVTNLVNAGGKIQANSVGGHVGTVTLNGVGGGITVEGQLDAMGKAPGTTGGDIDVNATGNVTVASGARIDASGQAGGGLVAIGTTLKRAAGGPGVTSTQTAANVTVAAGATIAANATKKGNGGRVTVLSTTSTDMAGMISATGGPLGGNGGFVEVSGNQAYSLTGMIDVSAPHGAIGTILLDPTNLDIIQGTAGTGTLDGTLAINGTLLASSPDIAPDTISNGEIQLLGGPSGGNVVLQTSTGTIGVHATIDITNALSLEAGSDLLIDRGVTITAGGLFLSSGTSAGTGSILIGTTTGTLGSGAVLLSSPTVVMQAGSASPGNTYGINLTDTVINNAGGTATTVDLSAASGGIDQAGAGAISTSTLLSSLGVTGTVSLAGTSNAIGSLGSINVTNGDFSLTSTGSLSVVGPLTGGTNVALNAGTIAVVGSIGASNTLLLNAGAGGIALNSGHVLSGTTAVDLSATGGGVTQVATGGSIVTGTLQSSNGVTGTVTLPGSSNTIAALGSFNVTNGDFSLTSTGSLSVAGPLTGGTNVALNAATIAVAGSIGASNTLLLNAGTGGIALNSGHVLSGTTAVDLSATGGGVTQVATGGSIVTGTLESSNGVTGGASLISTTNSVASIGNFAATTGSFALKNATALAVNGTLTAGSSNVSLETSSAGGITIGTNGSVGAKAATGLASFRAALLTIAPGGMVTGGTFEYSLDALGALTLGTGGELTTLAGVDTSNLRIGEVGGSITASSINIASTFSANGLPLELDTTGAITQTASEPLINVSTLTGSAGSVTLLEPGNSIAALGSFASAGNFLLQDGEALTVVGTVSAGPVLTGPNVANTNTLSLTTTGTLAIGATGAAGVLNAGTVTLNAGGALSEPNGSIIANVLIGAATGNLMLNSLGNNITTVDGLSAIGGSVTLVVDPPTVLTGNYTGDSLFFEVAQSDGTLQIGGATVPTAATLIANGTTNPTISLVADNITEPGAGNTIIATSGTISGTVEIAPYTSATAISLGGASANSGTLLVDETLLGIINTGSAGLLRIGHYTGTDDVGTLSAGNISLDGSVNLGTVAATLELDSTGSITEPGSIALTVATLTGTAASGISLLGSSNAIGTLGALGSTNGDILISDDASMAVAGVVDAGSGNIELALGGGTTLTFGGGSLVANGTTIGVVADVLDFASGSIIAGASGVVEIAPSTSLNTVGLGSANSPGTLGVTTAAFDAIDAGTVRIGAYHDRINNGGAESLTAGSIIAAGNFGSTTVSLELDSLGGITQTGGTLAALVLTGTAGATALLNDANAIGTLGAFGVSGGDFTLASTGSLSVTGPVSATNISLNAGTIGIAGFVDAATELDLGASAGGITESGSITAGTLASIGSITGGATLTGTNTIASIGSFAVGSGDFTLVDTGPVGVAGPLTAAGNVAVSTSGTSGIAVSGSIGAGSTLSLDSGSNGIALNGTALVTAATIDLNSGADGITLADNSVLGDTGAVVDLTAGGVVSEVNSGQVIAGTLQSSGGVGNTVSLNNANTVASLGSFAVTGGHDFELTDSGSLAVAGPVSAQAIVLHAGTIGLSGTLSAPGTTDLSTDSGGIAETGGGAIDTGFLQSSFGIAGGATLAGANTIAGIGLLQVTGGNLTLNNAGSLLISGDVSAPNILLNAGTVSLTGTLTADTLVALSGTGGGFVETSLGGPVTGAINAPTLTSNGIGTGTIVGGATLTGPNTISSLVTFTVTGGDLLLVDSENLTIAGAVSAADIFAELDLAGGTLAVGNDTTGGTLTATAGSNPTVSLVADNVTAGSAGGTIAATNGTVAIAPFSNDEPVSLGGTVASSGTVLVAQALLDDINLGSSGTLRIGSYNDATNGGTAATTAGNISVDGTVTLTASAGTLWVDSLGSIVESGTNGIQVTTLRGSAGNGATLTTPGSGNLIADLGPFTTGTTGAGDFALVDGQSLTVIAPVVANTGSVSITTQGALTNNSTIQAHTFAILLAATDITNSGSVIAVTNDVSLTATSGSITNNYVNAGGSASLVADTNLTTTGSVIAQGGSASLTASTGTLSNSGLIQAHTSAILLAATDIANSGSVIGLTNDVSLTATSGSITNNYVNAGGNALLSAGGNIGNSDVTAGGNATLTAGGGIANSGVFAGGSATLTAATLDITDIGSGVTASTGSATLTATLGNIAESGGVSAATTASLTADGNITQSAGTIAAAGGGVTLLAQTGTIGQSSGAAILATNNAGTIALTATQSSITTGGSIIAAGTAALVGLTAGTSITQSAGTILSGGSGTILSSGSATPNLSLVANDGTIGQAAGALIAATNTAGVIELSALSGNIGFAGTVAAPGSAGGVALVSGGTISETSGSGILQAGTLVGATGNGATLAATSGSGNLVASLGSFTTGTLAAGDFVLTDGQGLTVIAPVVANTGSVSITTQGTLTNNSTIQAHTFAILLAATDITNSGSVIAVTNDVSLTATSGSITNNYVNAGDSASLVADTNLTTTGSVIAQGGSASLTASTGTLSNSGLIQAHTSAILLAATDIANSGSVIGLTNDVSLTATSGSITNNYVNAGGNALLSAGGSIGNSDVTAGGNATLTAGGGIANSGVFAGGSATLTAATLDITDIGSGVTASTGSATLTATLGNIAESGGVSAATTASLTADGNITQSAGTIAAAGGGVTLLAQTGTIGQSSGAAILATNNAGTIALTATQSSITTGGSIIAAGTAALVGLTAGTSITQSAGTILSGGSGTILSSGSATPNLSLVANDGTIGQAAGALIAATNTAGVIELSALSGNIGFAGTVAAPGSAGGVALVSGGTISETSGSGILQAGTLVGATGNGATLAATSGSGNLVASLGSFTTGTLAAGDFVLTDGQSLTVIAPVVANTGSVSITTQGALTNNSTIQAHTSAILLAATDIANSGSVIGLTNDVSLTATSGSITNNYVNAGGNALLSAGGNIGNSDVTAGGNATLTAGGGIANSGVFAGGSATLTAATLDITDIGSGVTASTGSATLTATLGNIAESGGVSAATTASLTADGNITQSAGTIAAAGGGVTLLAQTGTIGQSSGAAILATNNAGTIALTATQSNVTTAGTVSAAGTSGVVGLTAGGAVSEMGVLNAGTLTGNIAGAASLTGTNQIANLSSFSATSLTLDDGASLTVIGPAIASTGTVAITTQGTLTNNSTVQAGTSATLLANTDITNTGSVIAQTGNASLTASTGTLSSSGLIEASTTVTLLGDTGLTNTGSVIAQTGSASLTASTGTLSNGGLIKAGTSTTLLAQTGLTNSGSVIAQTGSAALTASAGTLSSSGLIEASTTVTLLGDTGLTNTGSVIAQTGSAALTASAGTLSSSGLIEASTTVTLLGDTGLTNTGSVIAQTGNATLTATTGTLYDSGLISAAAANAVVELTASAGPIIQFGTSGNITAGGEVILDASGGITLNGLVKDDAGVILNSGGTIYQNGTLIADLLTGSAVGTVDLFGIPIIGNGVTASTNQVANLGSFTVSGPGSTFALDDGVNLLISGVVSAATIVIHDGSDTISLGNGGFITSGATRPPGALTALQLPPNSITTLGAYLYAGSLTQSGASFTVANLGGVPESILAITLPSNGSGSLQFSSGGLVAPNTWLILNVGNGSAGGPIDVMALDFGYALPPGHANFTGMIDGFSGAAAAAAAFIQPQPNAGFRVDGCPIHTVNCVLLATEGVPVANPADEINIGAPLNTQNPEDLVLPVVSDERYELVPCDDPNAVEGCPAVPKPPPLH